MTKLNHLLAKLLFLLAALILIPWLIPTHFYLSKQEKEISEVLGLPVRVSDLRFALLPTPRVVVTGIVLGPQADLQIARLVLVPSWRAVLGDKQIARVGIEQPVLAASAVPVLQGWLAKPRASAGKAWVVRAIDLDEARLPVAQLPPLDARVQFSEVGDLQSVVIQTLDHHLQISMQPQAQQQWIAVHGQDWVLPVGPPILFNRLDAQLLWQGQSVNLQSLQATLLDGSLQAHGKLNWRATGMPMPQFNVQFSLKQINIAQTLHSLKLANKLEGRLLSDGHIHAKANSFGELAEHLQLDTSFVIEQGVLHGVDLAKAATLLLKQDAKGGQTQFDSFNGHLHAYAEGLGWVYQLSQLHIASGLLNADGAVNINAQKQLDGEIKVALKQSVSLVGIPLRVTGSVDEPAVFPTKSALLGAATGTAVLGPGVGTSLGIKAGEAINNVGKLFGNSK
jgi:AsmA-like C-terminal region